MKGSHIWHNDCKLNFKFSTIKQGFVVVAAAAATVVGVIVHFRLLHFWACF